MFDRLPKPRKTFDPFNRMWSGNGSEKSFKFKRKRLSIRKSGTSIARLVIMFLAVIWFLYYLAK
ncbi:hypothetical protein E3V55_01890 [Candidatus Marinimicrobia bacterium MT.SAG.3]|nr:hypothetical protein E3V55_01890 [Candidatus Marinimicrobia bacterium MT.SAG.3]